MQRLNKLFRKSTGLNPYVWIVFSIFLFFFVFHSSAKSEVVTGITMIIMFFVCYVLSFVSKGWLVYFWTSMQIVISIAMSLLLGYVYFALFLAIFIGHLKKRAAFYSLYIVHVLTTVFAINYGLIVKNPIIISQLPFVLLSLAAVILLPINTFNKNKEDELQTQLEDANKRIAELFKLEERQRIARDLHDTLGQQLSLIGLKSELAGKLVYKNPGRAIEEMADVHKTARTALKEVREMVTKMRGTKLEDELYRIRQILKAAQIDFQLEGDPRLTYTSLIAENVIAMCLKESVNNVVKHSQASSCIVSIEPSRTELVVTIKDDGIGINHAGDNYRGNGLTGMKERLEFVNGNLTINANDGTELVMTVPNVFTQPEKEGEE